MIKIGHTKKTHGLNGNVKISIETKYIEDFAAAELLYIEINGSMVPYFIEDVIAGNDLIVKFEDIDDVDAARLITSKELFLREDQIIPIQNRTIHNPAEEYLRTEGFTMRSLQGELIGEITEVNEMPGQIMATVLNDGRELLVPLNEHFVVSIDHKSRAVIMDLPEGLLDL